MRSPELPAGIDYAVFDFAVNSGPDRASKYLQAAVGAVQDGRIGPATLGAVKARPAGVIIDALCDARLAFLRRLPTWPTFGRGWSTRVASVRAEALLLSAAEPPAAPARGQAGPSVPSQDAAPPRPEPAPVPAANVFWRLLLVIFKTVLRGKPA